MAITIKQLNITLHVSEGNGQESAVNDVADNSSGTPKRSNDSCHDQSKNGRSALVASTAKEVLRILKEQQER